jgi:hypothetical protein
MCPRGGDAALCCTKNAHWHRPCFAWRGTRLALFGNNRMGTFLLGRNITLTKKYTVGAYYSLTDTNSKAHNGVENDRTNFNLGSYLSF